MAHARRGRCWSSARCWPEAAEVTWSASAWYCRSRPVSRGRWDWPARRLSTAWRRSSAGDRSTRSVAGWRRWCCRSTCCGSTSTTRAVRTRGARCRRSTCTSPAGRTSSSAPSASTLSPPWRATPRTGISPSSRLARLFSTSTTEPSTSCLHAFPAPTLSWPSRWARCCDAWTGARQLLDSYTNSDQQHSRRPLIRRRRWATATVSSWCRLSTRVWKHFDAPSRPPVVILHRPVQASGISRSGAMH